jgi:sporulation integral membrane protein YlbJ
MFIERKNGEGRPITKLFSIRRFWEVTAGLSILCCLIGFLSFPTQAATAARDGIALCLDVIIPSLFPFFVLSTLLIELGLTRYLGYALEKTMRKTFNLSGACSAAVTLGFLGGYPVGAKTAITLYEKGLCSKTEAERLLSFCNNSGPAFILGAVGAGVFASSRAGLLLYLAHALASVTVGLIFRFYKKNAESGPKNESKPTTPDGQLQAQAQPPNLPNAFVNSVVSSFQSILNICAFVIFFSVAIKMLYLFGILPAVAQGLGLLFAPFGLNAHSAQHLLTGLIEITSGLWGLQGSAATISSKIAMAAFMLGWAGLSVHCQVLSFIGESGLRTWTYIVGKILHGLISAVYAALMVGLFGLAEPVSSYLAEQVDAFASMDFHSTLRISLPVASFIWLLFLGVTWLLSTKRKKFTVI